MSKVLKQIHLGRVVSISGQGFLNAYDYLSDWLSSVPQDVTKYIETDFPGMPGSGGTDHASFVAAGVPAFNLSALDWEYWNYTWHTNLDSYDKIVFDDLKNNVMNFFLDKAQGANNNLGDTIKNIRSKVNK